ncbi:helix-turn-helix domain-containing protein [Streptomyces sp. NPDC058371]|uniref:helix-turn-helix domain-containing protein n=1 Tax=Streptomyces sp. NPDC058371 TaxID=3346463 RepID=UPI003669656A
MSTQDDVEEFAALLRRLKARTDRSYGSLARRLNMNTSTLHRYCSGDTVPLEFASVERFAALCGASPAERMELHRLWIPAVAARRRTRPPRGDTAAAVEPADGFPSAGPTDPADGALAPNAPNSGDTTDPSDPLRPSDATDAVSLSVDLTPAADTAAPPSGEWTASGPALRGGGGPADVKRTPGRLGTRRRALVTAALTAALLGTVAGLLALPSGESGADAAEGTAPTSSASHADRPRPTPSTGKSAKNVRSSASASAKASASPSRGTGASGDPKEKKGRPAAVPLTWTANSQVWQSGCDHTYLVDKPAQQVPPPPAAQDAGAWALSQGAVHGRQTMVEISVQGRTSAAVVLEALRVRVVGRATPLPYNAFRMDNGCGGALTPRSFDVDLDKDRPIARSVAGNDSGTTIPAMRLPYRVSVEDPEVLLVNARTENCDCRWYLELDWSAQGRTGTTRIDDGGRPFRTSGTTGRPPYTYDTTGRSWIRYDN